MPSYASWLASSCPRPSYTGSGQAQKARGGAAFSIFPFFFIKNKKTDENELTAKKMNTKALKTVMIVDEQSWGGGEGSEGGAGPGGRLPACCPSASVPASKKGRPHRAQRPGQRGKAQEHGDWGHKHPPLKPRGQGEKRGVGDYKSQETTKLNTNVGTAGKGRGRGREGRGPVQADCPSRLQGHKSRLRPCSRCSPDSAEASPGRCRRGARSPHSPSRSGDSSCSL